MGNKTMIEKILGSHCDREVSVGEVVDILIDARLARDFAGANVVKNILDHGLAIDDPERTFFTFDCNPGGSDQKYAVNQQVCRRFARERGIRVYDVDAGIGTHIAIEKGLVSPGGTLVSTDSHSNIIGAIGAFGQGMGDRDIAYAWANGKVWFKVPPSVKIILKGIPRLTATAKDFALAMVKQLGANGLLGYAAEIQGDIVGDMDLARRVTISSMITEMGGIIGLFKPNKAVRSYFRSLGIDVPDIGPDPDAVYEHEIIIDIQDLGPMVARPGRPEDAVPVSEVHGTRIESGLIGSCTNGRFQDMVAAARVLSGRKVAPGVVLKIVPATKAVWRRSLKEGLIDTFTKAGALVGSPGCAGCAEGQIGQTGEGEVVITTGNRNFPGKQGKGEIYLASPATVAASAVAGFITSDREIPDEPAGIAMPDAKIGPVSAPAEGSEKEEEILTEAKDEVPFVPAAVEWERPTKYIGRARLVPVDNIDTDRIFHNRYVTITEIDQMGQYTFDALEGYEDFAGKTEVGDILITGKNFGCGSSRQQAVDCFKDLDVKVIIAESFGAIYERNAINSGMPVITGDLLHEGLEEGDEISIDLATGEVENITKGEKLQIEPFTELQMEIYKRGGLLE